MRLFSASNAARQFSTVPVLRQSDGGIWARRGKQRCYLAACRASRRELSPDMDDQFFAETADPKEIAERLGLTILGWLDGQLYARGRDQLYQIGPFRPQANYSGPADLRICFCEAWSHDWTYVGEQFHAPREGAEHAGLTVIGDDDFSAASSRSTASAGNTSWRRPATARWPSRPAGPPRWRCNALRRSIAREGERRRESSDGLPHANARRDAPQRRLFRHDYA